MRNISARQDCYPPFRRISVDGITPVIMSLNRLIRSRTLVDSCVDGHLSLFHLSIWYQIKQFSERLSVVLNDDEASADLRQLISQINRLNENENIWNGKIERSSRTLIVVS
jgi:hypothetical protein